MAKKRARHITLVVSESKKPLGAVKPGTQMNVVGVTLAGAKAGAATRIGARLCGGTSTCLAVIEIDKGDPLP